jgi:hypothetical protein
MRCQCQFSIGVVTNALAAVAATLPLRMPPLDVVTNDPWTTRGGFGGPVHCRAAASLHPTSEGQAVAVTNGKQPGPRNRGHSAQILPPAVTNDLSTQTMASG